jgi:pimeloyl-ACP methyl ester carboxylesterase
MKALPSSSKLAMHQAGTSADGSRADLVVGGLALGRWMGQDEENPRTGLPGRGMLMGYAQNRDQEQRNYFSAEIAHFIARYRQNPATSRKTVILFPGGMGSQLARASVPDGIGPPYYFDTIWLDCSVLFGAALLTEMQGDKDLNDHFVIANGCVEFGLMGLRPYAPFLSWCTYNELDWMIFPWDWRRRPASAASFFLNDFLPTFQQSVLDQCGADPLDDVSLIGHSFGGLVVKLILNHGGPQVDQIDRAITIGAPFYGHAAHLHRYFEGDPDLNGLFNHGARRVTSVLSTLRGGYALLPCDPATYNRDALKLGSDPHYPLPLYPCRDKTTDQPVDPYNPGTKNGMVRYPVNYRFQHSELANACAVFREIAATLPATTKQKFYNIRGVQTRGGGTVYETIHSQTWDWIPPNYDPAVGPSPIEDDAVCAGDGVIPAWSARLVSSLPENVRTVHGNIEHGFEHMDLLSMPSIQAELSDIMGLD